MVVIIIKSEGVRDGGDWELRDECWYGLHALSIHLTFTCTVCSSLCHKIITYSPCTATFFFLHLTNIHFLQSMHYPLLMKLHLLHLFNFLHHQPLLYYYITSSTQPYFHQASSYLSFYFQSMWGIHRPPHPQLWDGLNLLLLNDFAALPRFKQQGEQLIIHLVVWLMSLLYVSGAGAVSRWHFDSASKYLGW